MDCARNIVTANFSGGTSATTAPLWQWDYGQMLCITGIEDLPAAFEVHFSTNRMGGVSTVAVGADGQVTIPNDLLTIGKNLNAWIYLSDAQGEGETEYSITIPVKPRPMPETYDAEVTGEFDDVVRQVGEYAETAQTAADNAGASASAAAASADSAAASASAAESAKTAAETAQGNAEDAQAAAETAAQTATEKAQQTAQDAAQAAQSKADAESAAQRAEAAQTGAEAAKTAAEAAAQSAASIEGDVQTATQKAAEATAAAGQAVAAKDAAQTAQQGAETAATNAGQSASTATTKASEAAQSASNAADSETVAEAAATRAETAAASLTVDDALSDTSVNPVQNKVITGELTDVKSFLIPLCEGFEPLDVTYINGTITSTGTVNTNYVSRIVTKDIVSFDYPVYIKKADADYDFRVALYDNNGGFITFASVAWTLTQYYFPEGTHFRVEIKKAVETSNPASISLLKTKLVKQTNHDYLVDSLLSYESVDVLNSHIKKQYQYKHYDNSKGEFVYAGYCAIDTPLYYPFDITITNNNSLYMFNIKTFSDNKPIASNYIATSGWVSESYTVPKNTYFTIEFTTKNASVTPSLTIDIAVSAIAFTVIGMSQDIVFDAVDMAKRETLGFWNTSGYIMAASATTQEVYTQKYPVKEGIRYCVTIRFSKARDMWAAYALFDENENFISRTVLANVNAAVKSFDVAISDSNAAYISFTYRTYGETDPVTIASYDISKVSSHGADLLDRRVRLHDYSVNEHIKSINHRGYSTEAPENTLPAYKLSRMYGFKYAECDISFTKDDVPVLLHDATINRTARNADGSTISDTVSITSITYQQALQYDFGVWKGDKWKGVRIPTFEEFVTLCRNIGLHPYIEIKEQGMTETHVKQLVDIARNCGMARDVTWISFDPNALMYVLEKNPKARIGLLANAIDADTISAAQQLITNNNDVFINSGSYTAEEVTLCQNADIPMEVWNFTDRSIIASLPVYVSGITTDYGVAGYIIYQRNIVI